MTKVSSAKLKGTKPKACELTRIMSDDINYDFFSIEEIPMRYTFFKTFRFNQNDSVIVSTTSATHHVIDIILLSQIEVISNSPSKLGPIGPIYQTKPAWSSTHRDSSYQHLTYRKESIPHGDDWKARIAIKVPENGYYMVKVRCETETDMGVVDATINGTQYLNAPITYDWVDFHINDNEEYYIIAKGDNPQDDAMLYVEGGGGYWQPRIVAYSDDWHSQQIRSLFNLKDKDAVICETFYLPTYGLHVHTFSSNYPESTCKIYAFNDIANVPATLQNQLNSHAAGIDENIIAKPFADDNLIIEYFDMFGQKLAHPSKGVYIRRSGNSVSKILVK